jgi:transposase
MSEIPLNKYEKEKRVIEMHLAGMTIRQIASEVHMSFTPISKIIKAYERKAKRQENNQSRKPKNNLNVVKLMHYFFKEKSKSM